MDHHSNLIPWLLAAEIRGVKTVMAGVKPDGTLDVDDFRSKLGPKVKVAAFSHVSNVTGWISPVADLIRWTHEAGALAVVDGAQAVPHLNVDVAALDADFYAFSGHKMLAPMGIGVLYGKADHLRHMPPFLGGGDMLETLSVKGNACSLCLKELPWKFEAGTANVGGAVGLVAAMDYLNAVGWEAIIAHERALTRLALECLGRMKHVRVYGPEDPDARVGCVPFTVEGFSPNETATALDAEGIAIRSGFHCAQPLHQSLGLPSSARMSFYFYNTQDEVRRALEVLDRLR
jgi:cysteine desulfurase/selenocysteine lyase